MKLNVLSDSDVAILQKVIEREKRGLQGGRALGEKLWSPEEDQNTPDVYIALPPSTGIPALEFTGTSSVPGEGDTPGQAECIIYQLIDDGTNPPSLLLMDVGPQTVYNLSTTAITGNSEWITVQKTKTGKWVPVQGGGTSSSGGSSSSGCTCTCIDSGDLTIDDIETTSQWSVVMSAQVFKQTYGNINFPAGTYIVVWDSGTSVWTLDIGADLTAEYLDGSDATADTTMDGTLTLEWTGIGSAPSLRLCVDGEVPGTGTGTGTGT